MDVVHVTYLVLLVLELMLTLSVAILSIKIIRNGNNKEVE